MMNITSPVARIILRYVAAALLTKGFLDTDTAALLAGDPDLIHMLEIGLGAALTWLTERAYVKARAEGGPT